MNPIREVDKLLNSITMYRVVVYSLSFLLAIAVVFGYTGQLFLEPLHLAGAVALLLATCYISNKLFSSIFKVVTNNDSWIITALILACIVPPYLTGPRALAIGFTGVVAMLVKYVLIWRGAHLFNPTAVAAVIVTFGSILPVSWWIGSPPMFPFVLILGFLVLRKTRRFELFMSFALMALLVMVMVGVMKGVSPLTSLRTILLSWPLVFFGTIMLTEPATLPAGRRNLWLYGAVIGALFASQLRVGEYGTTPHLVLVLGNLVALGLVARQSLQLRLKSITEIGPHLYDLAFTLPPGKKLTFQPGQYAEWTFPYLHIDRRGNRRTFTIASSPTRDELHLGIKTYEPSSSYKKALLALQPGALMQVGHVGGSFVMPRNTSKKLLFVAGGIGITPFVSMLQYLIDTKQQRDIVLFYSVHDAAEAVYGDLLHDAEANGVTTIIETNRMTTESLKAAIPDAAERMAYVSGPDAMVHAYKDMLVHLGAPQHNIVTDLFSGY